MPRSKRPALRLELNDKAFALVVIVLAVVVVALATRTEGMG
ncbi:MAG: hypothetical protein ABL963_17410 [Longimicrobiales bacterium]